jgi:micrococcal nuclease
VKVLKNLYISGTLIALLLSTGCSGTNLENTQKQNDPTNDVKIEEKQETKTEEQKPAENKSGSTSEKPGTAVKSPVNLEKAVVARVVDGDTFELKDGTRVRLVGVNTPESTTRTEEYGKAASNYTKKQLTGKTVYLEKDVSDTDQYGRKLRILWLAPPSNLSESEIRAKMYNATLVLGGYAEPSTYPPDVKYADYFRKYAVEARNAKKGLWAIDPVYGTTKGDLDKSVSSPKTSTPSPAPSNTQTSTKGKIKGNINSKGEKIYHVPGGYYYEKTVAEELFDTEAQAQAAGYRKSQR